jgi:hypothetical protein
LARVAGVGTPGDRCGRGRPAPGVLWLFEESADAGPPARRLELNNDSVEVARQEEPVPRWAALPCRMLGAELGPAGCAVDVNGNGLGGQRLELRPGPGFLLLAVVGDGKRPVLQRGVGLADRTGHHQRTAIPRPAMTWGKRRRESARSRPGANAQVKRLAKAPLQQTGVTPEKSF